MRFLRWLLFLPVSAAVATLLGVLLNRAMPLAYYSRSNVWIAAAGLAPLFLRHFLPVVGFIVVGAAIAPKRGHIQIAMLGILAGLFSWPVEEQYSGLLGGDGFYVVEGVATLAGIAVGMLTAFGVFRRPPESLGTAVAESRCDTGK